MEVIMKKIIAMIACSLMLLFAVAAEAGAREEAAAAELARLGFPGVYVTKTSYGNAGNCFVAFTTKGCISADLRNGRAAVLENADEIVQRLREQQREFNDCLSIMKFAVPNDARDKDSNAGWWEGNTHHFQVYALYSIGNGGVVTEEHLFTGSGVQPGHYHDTLHEMKNVELTINTLTELNSQIRTGDIAPAAAKSEMEVTSAEAMERVRTFYYNLNQKYYDEAYSLFSQSWKNQVGFDGWVKGFATTVSQEVNILNCDRSGGVCRVYFQLRAVDNVDGQTVYSLFDGHWDVTRENGRIVLGNPEVRKLK